MDKVTVKELSDGWTYLINGHQGNNILYRTEGIANQLASKYIKNKYFSQSDSVKFGYYQVNIVGDGNRHYTYYVNQEGSKELYTFKTLYEAYKYVWNKLNQETTKVNSNAELLNVVKGLVDNRLWAKWDFLDQVQQIVSNPSLNEDEKVYSVVYLSQKAPKTKFDE